VQSLDHVGNQHGEQCRASYRIPAVDDSAFFPDIFKCIDAFVEQCWFDASNSVDDQRRVPLSSFVNHTWPNSCSAIAKNRFTTIVGIPDIVLEIGEIYHGTDAVVKPRLDDAGPRAGKRTSSSASLIPP
jgi:hypothetical protein